VAIATGAALRPSHPGVTVWFTGLPSAGKTTVANLVGERLAEHGRPVEVLDGDVVRAHLSRGLGFSKEDRDENIRRIGYVAGLLTGHGVAVLVSAISPYRAVRDEVRASIGRVGGFLEVHVATDLATCRSRDVKGLYARQARGELRGLTGVDDPYEPPLAPELVLDTAGEPPEASAARVLALLERRTAPEPPGHAATAPAAGQAPAATAPAAGQAPAAPAPAAGRAHAGTTVAVGRAPNREGSRQRDGGRTAVHSPGRDRERTAVDSPRWDGGRTAVDSPHRYDPPPHGGRLTERLVGPDRAEDLAAEAARLPAVALDGRGLADLECLAVGAFSPLTGFLGAADHAAVVEQGRLADGRVWTLPVALPVPAEVLASGPDRLALTDPAGAVLAVVDLEEVHDPDPQVEAKLVFETDDPAHPGVAATLARPGPLVGGPVHVLRLPTTPAELGPRLTPAQVRAEAVARGWRTMAGFQTRNPVHRAHEYLHKVALEHVDGLLLHPLVGETKDDDVPAGLRMACYRVLLEGYYPAERVLLSAFPAAMRYAGPREAVFHALVRKNYGCTHFIVGRDHAGVGSYYGTYAAQEAFDAYDPGELGIQPLRYEHAFFCRRCRAMATSRTCPHPSETRVHLSGTAVRGLLAGGQLPPPEFSRPEVARLLAAGYRAQRG
jgi:sulfate adenylyltransferase